MLDVIVLIAMAIVAAAFAAGLTLQAGLPLLPVLIGTAALLLVIAASFFSMGRGSRGGAGDDRVAELEDILSRADIIDVSQLSGDTVKFGAFVTLVDEDTDEESAYQIVGELEADVKQGRLSITSPIARALIGKSEGDSVEVNTPGGGKSYELLKVAFG